MEGNYAINFINGKELLHKPLYNLSQIKLAELRRYLKDSLQKGLIYYFIFLTRIPILFILKKDSRLYLYINYKGLNIITLKNRYLLPLIIKILNYLSSSKIFIKLDLKDTYYKIRIKEGNKQKIIFYTYYIYVKYLNTFQAY